MEITKETIINEVFKQMQIQKKEQHKGEFVFIEEKLLHILRANPLINQDADKLCGLKIWPLYPTSKVCMSKYDICITKQKFA